MKAQSPSHRNIQAICSMEYNALNERSLALRLGDYIVTQAGKPAVIVAHIVWFALWIAANVFEAGHAFDPFPFSLLTMVVSLEAIFLSLFILMSQNRSSIVAEQRNQLDLQINLLAEDENTKILQMLQALCAHHGLAISKDPEVLAFAKRTELKDVMEELKDNLPANE